jgi:hypothetical protein
VPDHDDDATVRRCKIAAYRVPEDWRRVFVTMGGDYTIDEWTTISGLDVEAVAGAILLAGFPIRRRAGYVPVRGRGGE